MIRLSVVIPAYRAWATLPSALEALKEQTDRPDREVIVVDSSGDGRAETLALSLPWVRVIALAARAMPGKAKNIGASEARGELIAFLDADAVPAPDWIDNLEDAMGDHLSAVAGAVLNGLPWHPIACSDYLLEFSHWLPARRSAPMHAAAANLLVRRQALEAAGGFPDMYPGEDTILTYGWAKQGRLSFASSAHVVHFGRTSLFAYLRHQRLFGEGFAVVCRNVGDFPYRSLGRPVMAPFAMAARLVALWPRLAVAPAEAARALLFFPFILLGLMAWTLGLALTK